MKRKTTRMMLMAALAAFSVGANAQVAFQQDRDFRDLIGWPSHRSFFNMMDFNNDGNMDAYYNGTSCVNGWACRGVLVKGLGNNEYQGDFAPLTETYTTLENVVLKNHEGNDSTDASGNPVYQTDENGDIVQHEVEHERFVGMQSGLPISAYAWAWPLDFNQDGLVDMLVQNRGGENTNTNQGLILVKNLGNYKFEVVNDSAIAKLAYTNGSGSFNEGAEYGAVSIADYDNDGFPDILFESNGVDPETGVSDRYVALLHNEGGKGYKKVNVFRPLAFDTEINHRSIFVKEADSTFVDEDGVEQTIPGKLTTTPTYAPMPMSHGAVMFIDLNDDGWKDIIVTGWASAYDDETGGYEFRYYKNTKDGWFQDCTDELIPFATAGGNTGTISDVFQAWGHDGDCIWYPIDYNQDGTQDLLIYGSLARSGKQAIVLQNNSTDGKVNLEEVQTTLAPSSGIDGAGSTFLIGDFNGDDVPDFYTWGWTDYQNTNDWRVLQLISEGTAGSYNNIVVNQDNNLENGMYITGGGMTLGDLNNDGKLDVVCNNWTDKGDDVIPSFNTTEYVASTPEAPENVSAKTDDNGNVIVTWDPVQLPVSGGQAMYNIYAIDANGNQRMIVPANVETGKQLAYPKFGVYAVSGLNGEPSYTLRGLPNGEYTIGVQAVSYNYLASAFTTTKLTVNNNTTAVDKVSNDTQFGIDIDGDNVTVKGAPNTTIRIFTIDGRQIAAGVANHAIVVPGHGVFVVKADNAKAGKFAK